MLTTKSYWIYSKHLSLPFFCCLFLILLLSSTYSFAVNSTDFVRREGNQIVAGSDEHTVYLRGVNLSADRLRVTDELWIIGTCQELAVYQSATPVTNWYQEKHFQYLADTGFNTIRVNLHYRIFEDDNVPGSYKQSGWDFIDYYIQWAKNHNLYLVLDIHIPQGGLQPTGGGGACLWDNVTNQTRLTNLWKAIAQQYADEPTIAAYDLLNEPNPTSSVSQWQTLAQQIVDAIRTVDQNHLIIIERVNWIFAADGSSPLADWNLNLLSSFQVSVNDDNVIYDYHFYDPTEYSIQNENSNPDDGNYPDENVTQTAKDGSTMLRNKAYLEYEINLENRDNGPMFVGEWGPNESTFNDIKGGYTYVQDVLNLFDEYNLHWTYYSMFNLYEVECCESGVICCSGDNPTTPHTELINVFSSYFSAQSTTTTTTMPSTTTTTSSTTTTISSQPCPTEEIFGTYSEKTELLRYFRDDVLSQTPEGQEIIRLYYEWSPVIVKAMEEDENFREEVKKMTYGVLGLIGEETD